MKQGINALISNQPNSLYLTTKFFGLTYLSKFLSSIVNEYRNFQLVKLGSDISIKFSKETINYLNQISYSEFKENSENIINSINKTKDRLDRINRFLLGNVISNSIEAVMISMSLYKLLGKKYLLTTLAGYYFYMVYSKKLARIRQKYFKERYFAELHSENKFNDIVNNIQTVKYFQGEKKESLNYSNLVKIVRKKDELVSKSLSFLNGGQNFILNASIMVNMLNCIKDVINKKLTPGDLFMLQGLFTQLMFPLHIMGFLMREFDETRTQLQYGIDIQKRKEQLDKQIIEKKNKVENTFVYRNGEVKFENVSFSYNKGVPVLNKINATFQPGIINCIVGESGQGKSTMFDLVYKMFTPSSGRILIDGQDISKLDTDSIRKYLTICPQNGHLFNESVQYNVLYGLDKETPEKISKMKKLLKLVNLHNKIKTMPQSYLTNVGTLGSKLSGGEKQRILFSRALLRDQAKIILLDETTSNLDSKNELLIYDLINNSLSSNKTIIITAHKLTTMKNADKIFVLEKGTFKEIGNHYELMEKKGIYYNMVMKLNEKKKVNK